MRKRALAQLLFFLAYSVIAADDDTFVVIGHSSLPKTDMATLQRLYTGRVVSIGQQSAVPVNLPPGNRVRRQFLETVLGQDEEQYTGYWLVRRYVGKGAPPQEVADVDEMLRHVLATPGAVGYLPLSRVPPGSNIIFRR
jgi:hypothetical protein